ncbi:response regulator [Maricaulis sp.]|uniref:response regulator n=1 Tax=Maricaulis sp. TaxID=1486257 RepID=UPI0026154E97|nr:response regulator [Maricaulis sp.]
MSQNCLQNLRVLIVEDVNAIRSLVRRIVTGLGASEVHDAADVASAWTALDAAPFDVMLLDYELNGEDGLSILEDLRLRADHPNSDIAVVVLTGHAEAHVVTEAVQKGADAYLVKPVAPDVLGKRIVQVLESRNDHGRGAPVSEVVWRRSNN